MTSERGVSLTLVPESFDSSEIGLSCWQRMLHLFHAFVHAAAAGDDLFLPGLLILLGPKMANFQ